MTEQESQIEIVNTELVAVEDEFSKVADRKVRLLEKKIEALDKLLRERDKAIEEVRVLRGLIDGNRQLDSPRDARQTCSLNVVPGEFEKMYVWQEVRVLVRRGRRAMSTRELVDSLEAGGKKLNAKNKASQVYTSIAGKTKVFCSTKRRGKATKWGLVEWKEQQDKETGTDAKA